MADINLAGKQGIQGFYQKAQTEDFARDFQMRILQMGTGAEASALDSDNEFAYITSTTLPNRQIINQATPYMGLSFNVPGAVTYPGSDGWSVTFRLGQNYGVRQTLEHWQRRVFDDKTSTGDYSVPGINSVIELGLIDNLGEIIRRYRLVGVYPVSLGEITYDQTGGGTPVTFATTLAYQYWDQPGDTPKRSGRPSFAAAGPR